MSSATLIPMRAMYIVPASALLIAACTGGGGGFSGDFQDTQDRAPNSLDRAQPTNKRSVTSNEGVASTTERAGSGGSSTGTGATAGFDCAGTYKCTIGTSTSSQKPTTTTLVLPGTCTYQGSGLNPDGTITKDGQVVGTWEATGTGFRVSEAATTTTSTGLDGGTTSVTVNVILDCTKVSDSLGGDDDDDVAQTPTVDAGARQ